MSETMYEAWGRYANDEENTTTLLENVYDVCIERLAQKEQLNPTVATLVLDCLTYEIPGGE